MNAHSVHWGASPEVRTCGDAAGDILDFDVALKFPDELELVPIPFPVGFRDGLPGPVVRRPMPIPTRTSVSREARPLMRRSSSHSTLPFSKSMTMVDPP